MKQITLAIVSLVMVSGCMKPATNASGTKEFATNNAKALSVNELPASILGFLQNPRSVESSAATAQLVTFGGGSCPDKMLNKSVASGYSCTYGTAAYQKSGDKFSEVQAEYTGWGYSAPKGFKAESTSSALYAVLAKYLGYDSVNDREKSAIKFEQSISEADVTGKLAGRSRSGKAYVITVKSTELASGMAQTLTAVLEASGKVWGARTTSGEDWNGTPIEEGPTAEFQFAYDGSSSSSQPASTYNQDESMD